MRVGRVGLKNKVYYYGGGRLRLGPRVGLRKPHTSFPQGLRISPPRTDTAHMMSVLSTSHIGQHYPFPAGTMRRCDLDFASHTHTHKDTHTDTHTQTRRHTDTHTHTHTHAHTDTHTRTC